MTADETNVLPFIDPPQPGMAFGCDPRRKEKFSLRQSRYVGLAESIQQIAEKQGASPQCLLQILDIGLGTGVTMRYVERLACSESLQLHGSDLKIQETMYRREKWSDLYEGDVIAGLPAIESDRFDVVVCEQVLEHVHDVDQGLTTLYRVLKPGGTLLVGVPIFPPGLHWIRRHLIPILDRLNPWAKSRGHVQAFSLASFKKSRDGWVFHSNRAGISDRLRRSPAASRKPCVVVSLQPFVGKNSARSLHRNSACGPKTQPRHDPSRLAVPLKTGQSVKPFRPAWV